MKRGFTLLEVLIVISIISILIVVFMMSSNNYVANADLKRQQVNSKMLESIIKQHKLDSETHPFGSKITKSVSEETKRIIEYQLKNSGSSLTYNDIKDSLYDLDSKKIKPYAKGQMNDLDRYFSSDSKELEGMVFTYNVLKTERNGVYSGSYTMLEDEGGETKPPEPPTICSNDPSTDGTIRLPSQGDGTITKPYLIGTIGEFQSMKLSSNSFFKLKNDIEACVTKDWNNGEGFEPLSSFTGSLDNSGFSINNLYINRPLENNVGIVRQLKITPGRFFSVRLKTSKIIGNNNVGIVGTFSQGALDGVRIENGYTEGKQNVGGLVGLNDTSASVFRSSYQGEVFGEINVGGVAGKTSMLDVTESYFRGKVTGNQYVGGVVGNRSDSFSTIKNVYLDVELQGTSNIRVSNGSSNKTDFVTNVFYNKDKTGSITADIGTGKTAVEMKMQSTYTGYDFTTKWIIDPAKNDGFPYLK